MSGDVQVIEKTYKFYRNNLDFKIKSSSKPLYFVKYLQKFTYRNISKWKYKSIAL